MTESNGLEQVLNTDRCTGEALPVPEIAPLCRAAAAEGIVLLKNQDDTLPIREGERAAVFGRCAVNYFGVGYGSGGDVRYPYLVNLMEGLANDGVRVDEELAEVYRQRLSGTDDENPDRYAWGQWPTHLPELPLEPETIRRAAERCDLALVVIGHAAGEDRESVLEEGSYYLTGEELELVRGVTETFVRVAVILDCGNLIDLSWTDEFGARIGALVYAWQGGMESGNALADVLTGRVNPSGRLTDTVPVQYEMLPSARDFGGLEYNNYTEDIYVGYRYFETFAPEQVRYPFGFGLSYTKFRIETVGGATHGLRQPQKLTIEVTNTGGRAGREVVQVYLGAPCGRLGRPARELAAFAKTRVLRPGETETLTISVDLTEFAAYDDSGVTGHKSAWLLEPGDYALYVGGNARDAKQVWTVTVRELTVLREASEVLAVKPEHAFNRLHNDGGQQAWEPVPTVTTNLREDILRALPEEIPCTGNVGITLADVKDGRHTLTEFIAQLTPDELNALSKGDNGMDSPLGVKGNAGALGGVTESLRAKGVPPVITTDGPAGIRCAYTASLLPCGTALASSFDPYLTERLYALLGKEMKLRGTDILLGPGMNIHRNPLCGRNFEYYSEDPFLTGKMAAAAVRGLQSAGVSACPKHMTCNNQETRRNTNDSRVSERAIREIYLKGFERMIAESHPNTIMSSYNKINGVWAHYNYELLTKVLRGEWGYDGLVLTDWWMQRGVSPEFPKLRNDAYRVRAQADVLMPGGSPYRPDNETGDDLLESLGEPDGITMGELQRTAASILRFCMKAKP